MYVTDNRQFSEIQRWLKYGSHPPGTHDLAQSVLATSKLYECIHICVCMCVYVSVHVCLGMYIHAKCVCVCV